MVKKSPRVGSAPQRMLVACTHSASQYRKPETIYKGKSMIVSLQNKRKSKCSISIYNRGLRTTARGQDAALEKFSSGPRRHFYERKALFLFVLFGPRVCIRPPTCGLLVDAALGMKSLKAPDLQETKSAVDIMDCWRQQAL